MEEAGEVSGAGGKWRPEEGEAVVVREEGATGGGGGAAPSLVGSPKAGKEGQSPGLLWRRWGGVGVVVVGAVAVPGGIVRSPVSRSSCGARFPLPSVSIGVRDGDAAVFPVSLASCSFFRIFFFFSPCACCFNDSEGERREASLLLLWASRPRPVSAPDTVGDVGRGTEGRW